MGDIVSESYELTPDGFSLNIKSASPFAIAWTEKGSGSQGGDQGGTGGFMGVKVYKQRNKITGNRRSLHCADFSNKSVMRRNKEVTMKGKKWDIIILSGLIVIFVLAAVMVFRLIYEYTSGDDYYTRLEEYVFLPDETMIPVESSSHENDIPTLENSVNEQETLPPDYEEPLIVHYSAAPTVNFEALKAQNPDVVGWIYSAGTNINYPVVQGDNNDEYLYRMVNGEENKCGSIFLDSLNAVDFTNQNSIIHGHHMKNGTMFADLANYKDQTYYDTHPEFWLVTPEKSYRIQLFTGFVTDTESDVWQLSFSTSEEFEKWKDTMQRKSYFASDVVPYEGERILTMSTCSYEYDDSRFVLMGVIRE